MHVTVIGGHGRTGKLVVKDLVAEGHDVTATIRNPKHKGGMTRLGAHPVMLDLMTSPADEFDAAIGEADAVVFAAGSGEGESEEIDRVGTERAVRAAERAGVKRFVSIAAIGTSTRVPDKYKEDLGDYYEAKRAGNRAIRGSELDWTIIEPGELTNGRATGKVTLSEEELPLQRISRADVAATVAAALADEQSIGHAFQVTRGNTGIRHAISEATH